jgi:hypothetical protein
LENLAGTASLTLPLVAHVRTAYQTIAPVALGDFVVIATAHHGAFASGFGWPVGRHLVRSGPDGADRQLLSVIEREDLAGRFAHVVIGSGDGIFAMSAARLQEQGVTVSVVSRPEALSLRLRLAVRDVRLLDEPEPETGAAALAA